MVLELLKFIKSLGSVHHERVCPNIVDFENASNWLKLFDWWCSAIEDDDDGHEKNIVEIM